MSLMDQSRRSANPPTASGLRRTTDIFASSRCVSNGPRLCENAKAVNRDRTTYSVQIAFGAHIAMAFNFEVKRKNIILVPLRTFEFSHRLGPERTLSRPAAKTGGKAEPSPPRTTSRLAKGDRKKETTARSNSS